MSNKSINQNQQYCIIFQIFKNNNIQIFIMNLGLFSIKNPSDKWSKLGPDNHQSRWPHQILLPVERRDVNTQYHHPVWKDYLIKNCIMINCVARESNPGRKNGNLAWYHYTSDAVSVEAEVKYLTTARLAQSVEHETLNLRVVGSSPTLGEDFIILFCMSRDVKYI